jgi:hypothetical protein
MYRIFYITGEVQRKHINTPHLTLEKKSFVIKIKLPQDDYYMLRNNFYKFNRWLITFLNNNIEFNNDMNDIRSYLHNTRIIRTHEFIDNIETYDYFKDIEGDVVIYSEYNNNYYNIRH